MNFYPSDLIPPDNINELLKDEDMDSIELSAEDLNGEALMESFLEAIDKMKEYEKIKDKPEFQKIKKTKEFQEAKAMEKLAYTCCPDLDNRSLKLTPLQLLKLAGMDTKYMRDIVKSHRKNKKQEKGEKA